jgi:dihydrofolate reductase
MKVYHVVAMAKNRVIGKENKLPWHFSSDLKYFKRLTIGSPIIMGRKTFESIGRVLPGRKNIVLSRTAKQAPCDQTEDGQGPYYFRSLDQALKNVDADKCFIIGGSSIYEQSMHRIDGIYLTQIEAEFEGDVSYPPIPDDFQLVSSEKIQEDPIIEVRFYEKIKD